jgi:hypothetical protein
MVMFVCVMRELTRELYAMRGEPLMGEPKVGEEFLARERGERERED